MKKRMTENNQRPNVNSYHHNDDGMNSENWFANHQKLLWGIGGAVVLGAGAMLFLKSKNNKEPYDNFYDELNALSENELATPVSEEYLITTITEIE